MNARKGLVVGVTAALLAGGAVLGQALAQSTGNQASNGNQAPSGTQAPPASPPLEVRGSAQAGERIATQGIGQDVPACSSCHAAQAVNAAKGQFPFIDGQSAYYLRKQLADLASGARPSPTMSPMAKRMTPQQMADVAVWYAGRSPGAAGDAGRAASSGGRGATIAQVGDAKTDVQACSNCHGGGGRGEWPTVPWLAGQPAGYLAGQLRAFRSDTRKSDANAQMRSAVAKLSDADLDAVARYYAALRPVGPGASRPSEVGRR